jgi:hypothetical protein
MKQILMNNPGKTIRGMVGCKDGCDVPPFGFSQVPRTRTVSPPGRQGWKKFFAGREAFDLELRAQVNLRKGMWRTRPLFIASPD